MKIIIVLVLILMVVFLLKNKYSSKLSMNEIQKTVYTMANDTKGDYQDISKNQVKTMVENGEAIVLDVRNINEIQKTGIIRGAINIPIEELPNRLNELNKEQTYITFCAVGGRSKKAASILSGAGFKKIYNAKEGMNTWTYSELIEK